MRFPRQLRLSLVVVLMLLIEIIVAARGPRGTCQGDCFKELAEPAGSCDDMCPRCCQAWDHDKHGKSCQCHDQSINNMWIKCGGPRGCHFTACEFGADKIQTLSGQPACECGWGGKVAPSNSAKGAKRVIGSEAVCDQILRKCCDKDPDYAYTNPSGAFCVDLLKNAGQLSNDVTSGWLKPFTGYNDNNTLIPPWLTDTYCNRVPPTTYRMQTSISGVHHGEPGLTFGAEQRSLPDGGRWSDYTNKLRFTDSTVAQEGLSFCIIGVHYKKSQFSTWPPLKGFAPIAQRSFDIGNHIHPDDPTRMNTFQLPNPAKLRGSVVKKAIWNNEGDVPTSLFKNVWLGVLPVFMVKGRTVEESADPVKLVEGFKTRPAAPDWQKDARCKNPYRVSVTLIEADGHIMKNYLHIRVYAQPISQPSKNCPTGKIKHLMLEVRDEEGLPVGQFTDDIPCEGDELSRESELDCPRGLTCRKHVGLKYNHMPCMFSHPKSNVHPSMFMFTAVPAAEPGEEGGKTPCPDYKNKPNVEPPGGDDYVTEVHATWRYAQLDFGMVTELHFATMIIEDDTPIPYYTSRLTHWDGVSESKVCVEAHEYKEATCPDPNRCVWDGNRGTNQHGNPIPPCGVPDGSNNINPALVCNWCDIPKERDCCWSYDWGTNYRPGRIQLGLISSCANDTYNTLRPYGYSAQYIMIKPTIKTRGGWDYFQRAYMTPEDVNCHVNINFGPNGYYTLDDWTKPFKPGKMTLRESLRQWLNEKYRLNDTRNPHRFKPPTVEKLYDNTNHAGSDDGGNRAVAFGVKWEPREQSMMNVYELPDWHTVGMTRHIDNITNPDPANQRKRFIYLGTSAIEAVTKMFHSAHQDPVVLKTEFDDKPFREYFGSRYILTDDELHGHYKPKPALKRLMGEVVGLDMNFTFKEMGLNKRNRCPCPFRPTTVPPELQTKDPAEIQGRKLHFISSLIAWVVLVPIGFFVARFYKETYSRVFFLQEFWWYTIHVLCLITALLFSVGGIYGLEYLRGFNQKRPYRNEASYVHIISGCICLGVFTIHLCVGAFRLLDNRLRIYQIALHWLFGWLEYLSAVCCIMSSSVMPYGILSRYCFFIYCGFLVFQFVFNIAMEVHLRRVDVLLRLDPPRAYLPPPMMRVFHTDAPHARFRVLMGVVFSVGCVLFFLALFFAMEFDEDSAVSIFQTMNEDYEEPDYDNDLPYYE